MLFVLLLSVPLIFCDSTNYPTTTATVSDTTRKIITTTSNKTIESELVDDITSTAPTKERLVAYTTTQKTIFFACFGGSFVLLVALAILSGLSDTILRSKQKLKKSHA